MVVDQGKKELASVELGSRTASRWVEMVGWPLEPILRSEQLNQRPEESCLHRLDRVLPLVVVG